MTRPTLRTAIGAYPHTRALKDGTVRSERLDLAHVEVSPIHRAFRPMVNDLAFDVSEMALVTYILARASGRPLTGLPAVLMRNTPHAAALVRTDSPLREPGDLRGRTLGVRAYTQTTGVWLRGILREQYGVDLDSLSWVALQGAHVDGCADPPNVRRAAADRSLLDLLLTGEIDAAVGADTAGHTGVRPLIPDAERALAEWSARTGITPINHVVVVKDAVAERDPWVPRALFDLFEAAKRAAGEGPAFGLELNRAAIEAAARFARDQGITPRAFAAEALFVDL